jgi:hypothetical protein
MTFIEDGSGKGNLAKVNDENQLATNAVTVSRSDFEMERGNAYNYNTGTVNLTSANKSALLYMENTGTRDIIITGFFYLL